MLNEENYCRNCGAPFNVDEEVLACGLLNGYICECARALECLKYVRAQLQIKYQTHFK